MSPAAADAERGEVSGQNSAALNAAAASAHLTMVAMRLRSGSGMGGSSGPSGSFQVVHAPSLFEEAPVGAPDKVWLLEWSDQAPLLARAPDGKLHEVRVQPNVVRRRQRLIAGCLSVGGLPPHPPEWFLPLANDEELGSAIDLPVNTIELDDHYASPACINP